MYREKIRQLVTSPALLELWKWTKGSHGALAALSVLSVALSGVSLVLTMLSGELVDSAVEHASGRLWGMAACMAAAVLLSRGLSLAERVLNVKLQTSLTTQTRAMMISRVLRKQYGAVGAYHSGELVNRMFSDVSIVCNGVLQIVPEAFGMAVTFLGAWIILLRTDGRLAAALLLGGLLGAAGIVAGKGPMKRRHKAVQTAQDKLHALIQETMENLRLIKASGSEARMEEQVRNRQAEYARAQLDRGLFSAGVNSGIGFVFQLSWLLCMLWGGAEIYAGRLSFGTLTAVLQLVGKIQGPLAGAAGLVGTAYGAVCSAERLKELTDLAAEPETDAGEDRTKWTWTGLEVRDLSFSYSREPVLEHMDLRIRPGAFIAVTGESGAGKSTLLQLLLGLYTPEQGAILAHFRDEQGRELVRPVSGRTRALFAYVPQGNTLFSGTIRENLCLFTDRAEDAAVWAALETACGAEFVRQLELGLDTVVGERGLGLSEGQIQRLAIARALLSGAPVLLLDESTSALDGATEERVLQNVARLRDKTCLIVTHRPAALKICQERIHLAS